MKSCLGKGYGEGHGHALLDAARLEFGELCEVCRRHDRSLRALLHQHPLQRGPILQQPLRQLSHDLHVTAPLARSWSSSLCGNDSYVSAHCLCSSSLACSRHPKPGIHPILASLPSAPIPACSHDSCSKANCLQSSSPASSRRFRPSCFSRFTLRWLPHKLHLEMTQDCLAHSFIPSSTTTT